MKDIELLKAIGEVDDELITEASYQRENSEKSGSVLPLKSWGWKKWTGAVAAVLAVCIIGAGLLPSFMSKSAPGNESNAPTGTSYMKGDPAYESENGFFDGSGKDLVLDKPSLAADAKNTAEDANLSLATALMPTQGNLKLIYTANVTLQTTEFDESEANLKAAVSAAGGYFENIDKSNGGYYSKGNYVQANYVVRIPSAQYDAFINGVGEICHVEQIRHNVQNVGEQYYELESRLETAKIKLDRLQELLRKADNMSDIITLQDEISHTEYQIDNYKGSLNRYDSLIDYSTVNIRLYSVARIDGGIEEDNDFLAKLGRSFKRGWNSFTDSMEGIAYALAENIFGIVIIIAALFVLIRFRLISKLWKKIRRK